MKENEIGFAGKITSKMILCAFCYSDFVIRTMFSLYMIITRTKTKI